MAAVGALVVQLTDATFSTGQEVRGCINFTLHSAIKSDYLTLFFKGKESVIFVQRVRKTSSTGQRAYGKHAICKRRYPVFQFENGVIPPGSYTFPISFTLPPHIPGSLNRKETKYWAVVQYAVKAKLEGGQFALVNQGKTYIRVIQSNIRPGIVLEEANTRVKTCCCCSNGEVRLKAIPSATTVTAGETVKVTVDVNNANSSVNVTGLVASLWRVIRMRADNGAIGTNRVKLSSVSTPVTVEAGRGYEAPVSMQVKVVGEHGDSEMLPSIKGNILECLYVIEVRAILPGCGMCCGRQPKIEREIIVPSAVPLTDITLESLPSSKVK